MHSESGNLGKTSLPSGAQERPAGKHKAQDRRKEDVGAEGPGGGIPMGLLCGDPLQQLSLHRPPGSTALEARWHTGLRASAAQPGPPGLAGDLPPPAPLWVALVLVSGLRAVVKWGSRRSCSRSDSASERPVRRCGASVSPGANPEAGGRPGEGARAPPPRRARRARRAPPRALGAAPLRGPPGSVSRAAATAPRPSPSCGAECGPGGSAARAGRPGRGAARERAERRARAAAMG